MAENPFFADPESLLSHRDFVRSLAKGLLFDEHRTEDIVQETWLAALKNPPRQTGNPRFWLRSVTKNLALKMRMRERRGLKRDRHASKDEALPSTADVVERESARREVVEAVLALEEPYRSMILFRFYENLPPREIAHRTETPLATVNSRLQRGLERLREHLDQKHRGNRKDWCMGLLPLVLPPAKTYLGGLTVAAVLLSAGISVSLLFWKSGSDPGGFTQPTNASILQAPAPEKTAPMVETPSLRSTLVETRKASIEGRVFDGDTGLAIKNARLYCIGLKTQQGGGPEGFVEFWSEWFPREIQIDSGAAGGVIAANGTDPRTLLEKLGPSWSVVASDSDAQGHYRVEGIEPGVFALVAPAQSGRAFSCPAILCVGPSLDSFREAIWKLVGSEDVVNQRGIQFTSPIPQILSLDIQEQAEVNVPMYLGGDVEGTVVNPENFPLANAEVLALPLALGFGKKASFDLAKELSVGQSLIAPLFLSAKTGKDGSFRLSGIAGPVLLYARASGFAAKREILDAPMRGSIRSKIQLEVERWVIKGRITTPEGTPVPENLQPSADDECAIPYLSIRAFETRPVSLSEGVSQKAKEKFLRSGRVNGGEGQYEPSDGSFDIPLSYPWRHESAWVALLVNGDLHELKEVRREDPPLSFIVDPKAVQKECGWIRIQAMDRDSGARIQEFDTKCYRSGSIDVFATSTCFKNGEYAGTGELVKINKPGTYDVIVSAPEHGSQTFSRVTVGAGEVADPLVAKLGPGATIMARLVDADERVLEEQELYLYDEKFRFCGWKWIKKGEGECAFRGLGAGKYFLTTRLTNGKVGLASAQVEVSEGSTSKVTLQSRPGEDVSFRLSERHRELWFWNSVSLFDRSNGRKLEVRMSITRDVDYHVRMDPGRYRYEILGLQIPYGEGEFEIKAGERNLVIVD